MAGTARKPRLGVFKFASCDGCQLSLLDLVTSGASAGDELNLVGMRTTDALRKLEEFLDQAYLTNQREVRVIHGIGSGALRKAVHEYLGNSPYCSGYHEADPHQGGAGATIVELNQ